jgi:hypothetical protein
LRIAPGATYLFDRDPVRVFKSAWFSKAAEKARIKDAELFEVALEVMK